MFHESSSQCEGKQSDIAAQNQYFSKIDKMINKKLEKHLDLEANFFENHPNDLYIPAKEALRLGICDYVGHPTIKIRIPLNMTFEVKSNKRHELFDPVKKSKYIRTVSGCQNVDIKGVTL